MEMKELKDALAISLKPLYQGMADDLKDKSRMVPFMGAFGEKYAESKLPRILFVGRSTYGWIDHLGWDMDYHFDWEGNRGKDDRGFARSNQIKKLGKGRSPFWGLIKRVAGGYFFICRKRGMVQDGEWYDKIAWSNVCKVSYKNHTNGNTDSGEPLEAQRKWCGAILRNEVACLQPKFVVLLVGRNWLNAKFPGFMEELGATRVDMGDTNLEWRGRSDKPCYMLRVYRCEDTYYLLTEHPQDKNDDAHVKVIKRVVRFVLDGDEA